MSQQRNETELLTAIYEGVAINGYCPFCKTSIRHNRHGDDCIILEIRALLYNAQNVPARPGGALDIAIKGLETIASKPEGWDGDPWYLANEREAIAQNVLEAIKEAGVYIQNAPAGNPETQLVTAAETAAIWDDLNTNEQELLRRVSDKLEGYVIQRPIEREISRYLEGRKGLLRYVMGRPGRWYLTDLGWGVIGAGLAADRAADLLQDLKGADMSLTWADLTDRERHIMSTIYNSGEGMLIVGNGTSTAACRKLATAGLLFQSNIQTGLWELTPAGFAFMDKKNETPGNYFTPAATPDLFLSLCEILEFDPDDADAARLIECVKATQRLYQYHQGLSRILDRENKGLKAAIQGLTKLLE